VPDIGDFADVAVIEVLVKVGDTVKVEQSLITVESDKASMEIPATPAWSRSWVKLGDKVNEGSLVLTLEADAAPQPRRLPPPRHRNRLQPPPQAPAAPAPVAPALAATWTWTATSSCWAAARRLFGRLPRRRPGPEGRLVERYATLGGVCLNVGCIPSKALLHVAAVMDEVATWRRGRRLRRKPKVDIDKLRGHKERSSASSPAAWPPWPRCAR
jgi:dihydrolipoamide dehydrogenase